MNILKIILQLLLVAMFAYFGIQKIIGAPDMVAAFTSFNYADWFMRFVGILEVGAAVSLLVGVVARKNLSILTNVGGFIIMILTIGAVSSHFFRQKNIGEGMIPLVVGLVMAGVLLIHNRNTTKQLSD